MIETKEQIIEHFKSGSKDKSNLKIGVEHEKFIFDKKTNTRIDYSKIKKMFENLYEFGWKPIFEEKNPIALTKNGKSITLEPGNQIELSGAKLNNIHEACAESHEYLFELNQVIEKLDFKSEIYRMDVQLKIVKTNSDKELVINIRKEVFIEGLNIPEHLEIDSNEESAIYILAQVDGKSVGTARWRETDKGIKLERFAVLNEYRSCGIGTKMTKFIINKLKFFFFLI